MSGKAKLTDKMIENLQNNYCIAIRNIPSNLGAMKNAILTSLVCSTLVFGKKQVAHTYCPERKNNWCGFIRIAK